MSSLRTKGAQGLNQERLIWSRKCQLANGRTGHGEIMPVCRNGISLDGEPRGVGVRVFADALAKDAAQRV